MGRLLASGVLSLWTTWICLPRNSVIRGNLLVWLRQLSAVTLGGTPVAFARWLQEKFGAQPPIELLRPAFAFVGFCCNYTLFECWASVFLYTCRKAGSQMKLTCWSGNGWTPVVGMSEKPVSMMLSWCLRLWKTVHFSHNFGICPRFRQLVDLNFIAAMTPSAGRPQITGRYQRQLKTHNTRHVREVSRHVCCPCEALQLFLPAALPGREPPTHLPDDHAQGSTTESVCILIWMYANDIKIYQTMMQQCQRLDASIC